MLPIDHPLERLRNSFVELRQVLEWLERRETFGLAEDDHTRIREALRIARELDPGAIVETYGRPDSDRHHDALHALLAAAEEIRSLRRANELLGAKVGTMELLGRFLNASHPTVLQGYGEDIAWRCAKVAQELQSGARAQAAPPDSTDG